MKVYAVNNDSVPLEVEDCIKKLLIHALLSFYKFKTYSDFSDKKVDDLTSMYFEKTNQKFIFSQ